MANAEGLSAAHSLPKHLAEVCAEGSKCDPAFNGLTGDEIDEHASLKTHTKAAGFEDALEIPEPAVKRKKTASKRSAGGRRLTLRVSLRLRSQTPRSGEELDPGGGTRDEDLEVEDLEVKEEGSLGKNKGAAFLPRKRRRVNLEEEEEEKAVVAPSVPVTRELDSEEDSKETFLSKREQNIKENKAMLAQLMADLQRMPGGAETLKNPEKTRKPRRRGPKPPRSPGEPRRNSERVTRRQTRSMGVCEEPSGPELELSLEDELLEVRHAPRSRAARPSLTKPHQVRPVEDITEHELQQVADMMTEKVYNSATGTTCHQCRQKTIDTKTCCRDADCRGIQGQFCGPCLKNRYGEEVKEALLDPGWRCPACRGICNCSFCRTREGRCPTGILFPMAQFHGFSDVHSYLSSLRNKPKSEVDDEGD